MEWKGKGMDDVCGEWEGLDLVELAGSGRLLVENWRTRTRIKMKIRMRSRGQGV